jgi:hypothetical protein
MSPMCSKQRKVKAFSGKQMLKQVEELDVAQHRRA